MPGLESRYGAGFMGNAPPHRARNVHANGRASRPSVIRKQAAVPSRNRRLLFGSMQEDVEVHQEVVEVEVLELQVRHVDAEQAVQGARLLAVDDLREAAVGEAVDAALALVEGERDRVAVGRAVDALRGPVAGVVDELAVAGAREADLLGRPLDLQMDEDAADRSPDDPVVVVPGEADVPRPLDAGHRPGDAIEDEIGRSHVPGAAHGADLGLAGARAVRLAGGEPEVGVIALEGGHVDRGVGGGDRRGGEEEGEPEEGDGGDEESAHGGTSRFPGAPPAEPPGDAGRASDYRRRGHFCQGTRSGAAMNN